MREIERLDAAPSFERSYIHSFKRVS